MTSIHNNNQSVFVVLIGSVAGVAVLGVYLIAVGIGEQDPFWATQDRSWELVIGISLMVLDSLVLCMVVFLRKKLSVTCALIREACGGINSEPSLFLAGAAVVAFYVAFCVLWCASVLFIFSIPTETIPIVIPSTGKTEQWTLFSTTVTKSLYFMVFGFFWVSAFCNSVFQFSVAGCIGKWYFSRDMTYATMSPARARIGSATWVALARALTLSFGSLAFGSLIIAIIDFLMWLVERTKRMGASSSRVLRAVACVVQGCLWCVKRFASFINRFAVISIALHGWSFCKATREVASLVSRNAMQAVVLDTVTRFVVWVGKLLCTAATVILTIFATQRIYHDVSFVTMAVVLIGSYAVFGIFSAIIGTAADTVFVCYIEDIEANKEGSKMFAGPELHALLLERARESVV